MSGNLDSFIISSKPQPQPIATSQEIRDRASLFLATIYAASTPAQVKAAVSHITNVTHAHKPASHEMYAWRCMVLKAGRTGLAGPHDFEVREGCSDDGERGGGEKILAVLRSQGVLDAVCIVSRWYGGIMLGPARFSHIETCAVEVCREFKRKEEVKETLSTLHTLDDTLAQLRRELAASTHQAYTEAKVPDYSAWIDSDLPKAKRLIRAREGAITSVKNLLLAAAAKQGT
ncbi:ribosomal protein S5 domain 2-type protein [Roridomyces roridus]|uniref:Ribosomal protein S5 domain 2-type protein n=1 Tax=Roridomyces roridus TaxID=1738132 RepID=A0AAD7G0T5_9AGAR|nr:ribosomal protein S5 domain 2-type protein [Roridomyces roridus]